MNNLTLRLLTMVVLIPLTILILWLGGWWLYGLLAMLWGLMIYEWVMLVQKKPLWILGGSIYITLAMVGAFWFYLFIGWQLFLLCLVLVWMNDIGGYVFGKWLGGPKLAPRISPKKTWAGLLGGGVLCILTMFLSTISGYWPDISGFYDYSYKELLIVSLLPGILVSLLATIGDLLESGVKRHFGVKDSGNIIPGHGGILDRMDGALLVFMVVGWYFF